MHNTVQAGMGFTESDLKMATPLSTADIHSPNEPAGFQVLRKIPGNGFAVRLVHYAAGYRQKLHSHSHHGISFLIAGGLHEQVRRREEAATPFSLVIKPAEILHTDWVGPEGAQLLQIRFDADNRDWHESGIGGRSNWRWLHYGPGLREMVDLLARVQPAPCSPTASIEEGVIDLLAALAGTESSSRGPAPAWLRPIKEQLDDAVEASPSVQQLADRAGVHPVSLSRAFRRHYCVSITHYRRLARFRRAVAVLTGSGHNLCAIAHACGYSDHAHFCRDLRTLAGVSPGVIRDLVSRVSYVQER